METPEIEIDDFQLLHILEGKERDGGIERELFKAFDERSTVVWS